MQSRVRAFREELRKKVWASDVNVQFDERWTIDNMDLIRSAATNLVELRPDAIMAVGDTSSEPGADMRRSDFITLLADTAAAWPREV